MIPIQLADIVARLDHISEVWRSGTSDEQRTDLADLDELLSRLDTIEPETAVEAERIDELRGRIEILMDEIEISLDIDPPAFYSPRTCTPVQTSGFSSTTTPSSTTHHCSEGASSVNVVSRRRGWLLCVVPILWRGRRSRPGLRRSPRGR